MAGRKRKQSEEFYNSPTPFTVGLSGCCPRCGQGRLFDGMLKPSISCSACELDYSFINSGDGPAVFVILILGFLVTGLAMILETSFSPPFWVHMVLLIPLITIFSIWALRICKGLMIALQYQADASEGRTQTEMDGEL